MKQKDIEDDPFVDIDADVIPYEEGQKGSDLDLDSDSDSDSELGTGQETAKGGALVRVNERDSESDESHFSITEALGGGIIAHKFLRRNWGVIALVIFLTIIYVSNRYAADQELIRINDLQRELEEVRYRALTHSSELTNCCRQSYIEERLAAYGDTTLAAAKESPFVIYRNK